MHMCINVAAHRYIRSPERTLWYTRVQCGPPADSLKVRWRACFSCGLASCYYSCAATVFFLNIIIIPHITYTRSNAYTDEEKKKGCEKEGEWERETSLTGEDVKSERRGGRERENVSIIEKGCLRVENNFSQRKRSNRFSIDVCCPLPPLPAAVRIFPLWEKSVLVKLLLLTFIVLYYFFYIILTFSANLVIDF